MMCFWRAAIAGRKSCGRFGRRELSMQIGVPSLHKTNTIGRLPDSISCSGAILVLNSPPRLAAQLPGRPIWAADCLSAEARGRAGGQAGAVFRPAWCQLRPRQGQTRPAWSWNMIMVAGAHRLAARSGRDIQKAAAAKAANWGRTPALRAEVLPRGPARVESSQTCRRPQVIDRRPTRSINRARRPLPATAARSGATL